MQLLSVEIHGFKSFANKTRLDFGPGITAIIGPNGVGKSCIADAIRWVLGERSLKELRGKKTGDVIFSGSDSRNAARRATVTLTFENESGRLPIEAPEVTIQRTVSRDGESDYTINGDRVRLIDLHQILSQAGIGIKSFSVISQGMVDRYLTAAPEVRRELFDEATGVKALQLKLHQSQLKLDKTRQHAQEVRTIINELKPQLTVLKRQIQRYEERGKLQREFEHKQEQWFAHTWHTAASEITRLQSAAQELNNNITHARKAREHVEQQLLQTSDGQSSTVDIIKTKLEQAHVAFRAAQDTYKRISRERRELTDSLTKIHQARIQADKSLKSLRQASTRTDWISHVQDTLQQCSIALNSLLSGEKPDHSALQVLSDDIDSLLQQLKKQSSIDLAKSVLKKLERPLQEVARLKAIEEERMQQLNRLPKPEKPSDRRIKTLETALKRKQSTTRRPPPHKLSPQALERVREAELAAEREGSAVRTALEQAQQELHRIEQDILRERGTLFLSTLKTSSPKTRRAPSEQTLHALSNRIAALGESDPLVIKEYEEVSQRYEHLQQQMNDIHNTRQNILRLMRKLEHQIHTTFREQFSIIQAAFSKHFHQLFGGGKALLDLTEEGVDITVIPPGKRARHVALLSGGERALTSLALLLAILQAGKPPFIVLDEVDAALDEANSARFASILQAHSKNTQCIIISHNRLTMAMANVLYGVTMQREGVSRVYSVNLADIEEVANKETAGEKMKV